MHILLFHFVDNFAVFFKFEKETAMMYLCVFGNIAYNSMSTICAENNFESPICSRTTYVICT